MNHGRITDEGNNAGNNFGPLTKKKLGEILARIRVNFNNINLDTQDELAIKTEFQQINYDSWTAINAIEQDLTER